MITGMLKSYVALYVPTTFHLNQPADTRKYRENVRQKFSGWFGGATVTEAEGDYASIDDENVAEKIYIVKAFCTTKQLEEHFIEVVELGDWLCRELEQESVAGEINGKMFFVNGK